MKRILTIQAVILALFLAWILQSGCSPSKLVTSPMPLPAATPTPTPTPNAVATAITGAPSFNLSSGVTTLTTGAFDFSSFHVGSSAVVTISGAVTIYTQSFTVDAGATVTGVGQGYIQPWFYYSAGNVPPSNVPVGGPGVGSVLYGGQAAWYLSAGGGHGGAGGTDHDSHCVLAAGGSANDDPVHPKFMGSSGDSFTSNPNYSNGGGLLAVVVYNPAANKVAPATVNGTIDMSGYQGCLSCGPEFEGGSGGAGGAIVIEASTVAGTGVLQANGGTNGTTAGAGGGGGIISLIENSTTFGGTLSAAGGFASSNNTTGCVPPSEVGAAGSVTFTAPPASGF